ncbi:MAG: 30S ribosome-binding factor RbfA [Gammaproteobacteria bacterium]|nr:30S ribosome-binding factor RbfA [Gammaproteobacteria bacterium]
MRKESGRTRKIGELIQRELAGLIAREMNDPRVAQVTITSVDVAPDLSHAKVYITHLAGEAEAKPVLAALKHAAGFLRHALRERVILRHTPELRFVYDVSVEQGDAIERLLAKARAERDER